MDKKSTTQIVAIEGWPWVAALGFVAVLFFLLSAVKLALFVLVLAAMAAFYFRNPERIADEGDLLAVTAPIDGRVESVTLQESGVAITLLNTPLDTHLLRAPCAARFVSLRRRGGLPGLPKGPLGPLAHHEEIVLQSEGPLGRVRMVLEPQMALPRYYLKPDAPLFLTQRIGFFHGGRVTLLLPRSVELRLAIGDRVVGGESAIGFIRSGQ